MPPLPQRRNGAYLNRRILAIWRARPRPGRPGTETKTGLAIDLGGSGELRFRPTDGGAAYLDEPLPRLRRVIGGAKPLFIPDLCVLTLN
jgi:hypothetical protein